MEYRPALVIRLAISLGNDEALEVFRVARRFAEEEFGPAPLRGGRNGPWLRWRRPGAASPRLSLRSDSDNESAWVYLELLETEKYENGEYYKLVDERLSWYQIIPTDATNGMMIPWRQSIAKTWENFEERLAGAIHALVNDLRVLGGYYPLTLMIEERCSEVREPNQISACFIRLAEDALRIECPTDVGPDAELALTEMGWTPPSHWITVPRTISEEADWTAGESPFRDFPLASACLPTTSLVAEESARFVVGALRVLGAELFNLTYWVGRNGDNTGIRLPELGI